MSSKKLYIGKVSVTFTRGETVEKKIFKSGRTIWVNDHIVHPMNRDSFEGVINEISVIHDKAIEKWEWLESGPDYDKLQFRNYKTL
ncbi:hypothetical protein ACFLUE_02425 [Chloroflexota bacterium]